MNEEQMPGKNQLAARKGKAAEQLIAAYCMIGSNFELNALTSVVDDEGVDIVFQRYGATTASVDVQVKTRFTGDEGAKTTNSDRFMASVRTSSFVPRPDLYFVFPVIDIDTVGFEICFLVPSTEFVKQAMEVYGGEMLRISASLKPGSKDQWARFKLRADELPGKIVQIIRDLES